MTLPSIRATGMNGGMPTVSILIPTYKRPELLRMAIASCLAQTFQDFEIVVSDDSSDTRTAELIESLSANLPIRYVHNVPGLGQARNVNQLFHMAAGEFLVLLHDDNFLMPSALSDLIAPLRDKYLASHEGDILDLESKAVNERYSKTDDRANKIQRSEWSALAGQFPPAAYMAPTAAVRSTLYRDDPEVGQACDADFGYRLSRWGDFFFVGEYTSAYRVTRDSISSRGLQVLLSKKYFIMEKLSIPIDLENVRRVQLKRLAPVAVNGCLLTAARGKALRILFGENYPWRREFIKGGIQLCLALVPRVVSSLLIQRRWQFK